jgi:ribosomal protein S21
MSRVFVVGDIEVAIKKFKMRIAKDGILREV